MEPQLTDNDLILRYREGDTSSFMVLLDRYECKVFGYIYSLLKDNEIANEIFEHTFYKFIITLRREQYDFKNLVETFVSNIEPHLLWYDIPFAYIPGWKKENRWPYK